ncbi:myeloid cell surface antigen CD33-like [Anoplopoma fimbria]|uniref:myeloid cell surface antigen CD33-like n=1 Tax=Anoplopoma fimbria TaxID=229290 RepID=UPI0023EC6B28|nr:myeloid cell surface antigen CD33-like [Anoplopoma fimbria]
MFVLIWATLLFSVRGITADTGASVGEITRCQEQFCITLTGGEIKAEAGLCVVIPCSFNSTKGFTLQRMLFMKCEPSTKTCKGPDIIFSTDENNQVQSGFIGRLSLLEPDMSQRNCSIIINDLTESDSGSYQLRVEGSLNNEKKGFTFQLKSTVSVKGLTQKPTVMVPPLTEGQQTTLTCTAPGLCSGSDPKVTWTWRGAGEKTSHITGNITAFKTENLTAVTKRHSSTLTFNPSAEQHGSNVTCKVSFTNNISTEETVTLNVTYLLNAFLLDFSQPEVIIAFFIGILLASTLCCLAVKCCRNKQKNSAEALEMIDAGQGVDNDQGESEEGATAAGQSASGGDVEPKELEYSDIDFSLVKRKSPLGAENTQETKDTEYAEIKNKAKEERQNDGAEEVAMVEGSEEEEVMVGEDEETKQYLPKDEEGGEDVAVYSNVKEIMCEIEGPCSVEESLNN